MGENLRQFWCYDAYLKIGRRKTKENLVIYSDSIFYLQGFLTEGCIANCTLFVDNEMVFSGDVPIIHAHVIPEIRVLKIIRIEVNVPRIPWWCFWRKNEIYFTFMGEKEEAKGAIEKSD